MFIRKTRIRAVFGVLMSAVVLLYFVLHSSTKDSGMKRHQTSEQLNIPLSTQFINAGPLREVRRFNMTSARLLPFFNNNDVRKARLFNAVSRTFNYSDSAIRYVSQPGASVLNTSVYHGVPVRNKTFQILVLKPNGAVLSAAHNNVKFSICPYSNCRFLNSTGHSFEVAKADAVIVHMSNTSLKDMFDVNRTRHQVWIAFQRESPGCSTHRAHFNDPAYNGWFNATMLYERTADATYTYGYIDVRRRRRESASFDLSRIQTTRPRRVAWFVSHCRTDSHRERYVRELQKYIPVDIYGKCGNMSCDYRSKDCYKMLETEYKFYLSFENSLCVDYVTEKLFKILEYNVVPIVLGAADYDYFVPPHSFIDVRDFSSPQQLAEYLYMLDSRDDLYLEYFEWKRTYKSVVQTHKHCQFCAYLNRVDTSTHIVERLDKFYDPQHNCVKPEKYYSGHAAFSQPPKKKF